MLRNLFAGSANTDTDKNTLLSYLQVLPTEPSRLAGMLAIFVIPVTALGWWCYSVVMSVGAATPLQSTVESSSEVSVPGAAINSDAFINSPDSTSSISSSSDTVDVKVNTDSSSDSNTPQTTVKIDGQTVPVNPEGNTHQVIHNDNGKTTVDINIDSDTTGGTKTRSSTDINLRSSSSSDVDIRSRESN